MALGNLNQMGYEFLEPWVGKNIAGFVSRVNHTVIFFGEVSDSDQNKLPNTKVCFYVRRNFFGEVMQQECVTDKNGEFECRFDWCTRPLDSHEFNFIFKIFKNSTSIHKIYVNYDAHSYPRFDYLRQKLQIN